MAKLALGIGGAVVGSFFGAPQIGYAVGSALGGALFPTKTTLPPVVGPRLTDLNVMSSAYGQTVPIVYGVARLGTNVIWSKAIREVRSETSQTQGGKGGGPQVSQSQISYQYFATFAVAVCEGPVQGIGRIWADGKVVWDAGVTDPALQSGSSVTIDGALLADLITAGTLTGGAVDGSIKSGNLEIYTGTETQSVSPTIEAHEGVGNTPAYRGLSYIVFNDIPLESFGNRIPQITVEVARRFATSNVFTGFNGGVKIAMGVSSPTKFNYMPGASDFSLISNDDDMFGLTEYRTSDFNSFAITDSTTQVLNDKTVESLRMLKYQAYINGNIIAYPAEATIATAGTSNAAIRPAVIYTTDGGVSWQYIIHATQAGTCRSCAIVNGKVYMSLNSGSTTIGLFEYDGAAWNQLDATTKMIFDIGGGEFHVAGTTAWKLTTDFQTYTASGVYNVSVINLTRFNGKYYGLRTNGSLWKGTTPGGLVNTYATGALGSNTGSIPQLKLISNKILAVIRYSQSNVLYYIDQATEVGNSITENRGLIHDVTIDALGDIYVSAYGGVSKYTYTTGFSAATAMHVSPGISNAISNISADASSFYLVGRTSFAITDTAPSATDETFPSAIYGNTNWKQVTNQIPLGCFKDPINSVLYMMTTFSNQYLEMKSTNNGATWTQNIWGSFSASTPLSKSKTSVFANGKLYSYLGGSKHSVMVQRMNGTTYERQVIDLLTIGAEADGRKIKASLDGSLVYTSSDKKIYTIDTTTDLPSEYTTLPTVTVGTPKIVDVLNRSGKWYLSVQDLGFVGVAGYVKIFESTDLVTWTDVTPNELLFNGIEKAKFDQNANGDVFLLAIRSTASGNVQSLYLTADFSVLSLSASLYVANDIAHLHDDIWCVYDLGNGQSKTFGYTATVNVNDYSSPVALSDIITDISERSSVSNPNEFSVDVSGVTNGYIINSRSDGRRACEPLLQAFSIEASEGEKVKFTEKSKAITSATIPQTDLIELNNGDLVLSERSQELSIPQKISIDYIDIDRDYEINSLYSSRIDTESDLELKLALPIVLSANQARKISEKVLYTSWIERTKRNFSVSHKYSYLEPGDIIDVVTDADTYSLRIVNVKQGANGQIDIEALDQDLTTYLSNAVGDTSSSTSADTIVGIEDTQVELIDLAALNDNLDTTEPALYVATHGDTDAWPGCAVYESLDGGVSWDIIKYIESKSSFGVANTVLAAPANGFDLIDNVNTVEVQIQADLSSVTELNVLNGANAILIGDEIIQFENAVLTAPNTYTLSTLTRGRKGTFDAATTHSAGERAVLLDNTVSRLIRSASNINNQQMYKFVTFNQSIANVTDTLHTFNAGNLRPVPVGSAVVAAAGADFDVSWERTERINSEWVDGIDVPLADQSVYEIDIISGTNVLNTYTVNTNNFVYSIVDQINDFGASQTSLTVKIYRLSAVVGRGRPATASI